MFQVDVLKTEGAAQRTRARAEGLPASAKPPEHQAVVFSCLLSHTHARPQLPGERRRGDEERQGGRLWSHVEAMMCELIT